MEKEKEKVYEENDNKSFLEKRGKKEGEGGGGIIEELVEKSDRSVLCSVLENLIMARSHVNHSKFNYQRSRGKLHSKVSDDTTTPLAGLVRYTCQSRCGSFRLLV